MTTLTAEIDANFDAFRAAWPEAIVSNLKALEPRPAYRESYRRIASFQALKAYVIEPNIPPSAAAFFIEAQNYILLSHVQASIGSWRISLQSLRAAIENVCACLYFMDHSVELELWKCGEIKLSFSSMTKYFEGHPSVKGLPSDIVFDLLKEEYATLSKAVHGSAVNFWMTKDQQSLALWTVDEARAGMWASREKNVLRGLSILTIVFLRDHLSGTKASNVRDTLSLLLTSGQKKKLSDHVSVKIT